MESPNYFRKTMTTRSYLEHSGLNAETVTQIDSEFNNMSKRVVTHTCYMFRNSRIDLNEKRTC